MTEPIKANLMDLEGRKSLTDNVSNQVLVQDGDKLVKYSGWAFNLWFDGGDDLRGNAVLVRKDTERGTRQKLETIGRKFPFRRIVREVPEQYEKETEQWKVYAGQELRDRGNYFITTGKSANGYNCSAHYRSGLLGNARNQGLTFTHQLLDLVFDPIDEKLMQIMDEAKRIEGGRK